MLIKKIHWTFFSLGKELFAIAMIYQNSFHLNLKWIYIFYLIKMKFGSSNIKLDLWKSELWINNESSHIVIGLTFQLLDRNFDLQTSNWCLEIKISLLSNLRCWSISSSTASHLSTLITIIEHTVYVLLWSQIIYELIYNNLWTLY